MQTHVPALGPASTLVAIDSLQTTGSAIFYIDAAGHVDVLIDGANNWQHSSLV